MDCVFMPGAGLEPARPYGQGILSPHRLPFRHPGGNECAINLTKDPTVPMLWV